MKHILLLLACVFLHATALLSQEFKEYPSGLIYSDSAIGRLRFTVETLNKEFLSCEMDRQFLSLPQTLAHYVSLSGGEATRARADLETGIDLEDFLKKYPAATVQRNVHVIAYERTGKHEAQWTIFLITPLNNDEPEEISGPENDLQGEMAGKWRFRSVSAGEQKITSLSALYFPGKLLRTPLPERHARLVQYAYCLIDTNATVFLPNSQKSRWWRNNDTGRHMRAFLEYIDNVTGKPVHTGTSDASLQSYKSRLVLWESARFSRLDSLASRREFRSLIEAAIAEALKEGGSDNEFENYVARYYSKRDALMLKRSRRVIGFCSMDDSPREHSLSIAHLAAESFQWEVFLRAHLDIMNDRFERAIDASYAQPGRQTYIRELEELGINVPDLLLGITLRVDNPVPNHYFGSIYRLARAIAESRDLELFGSRMSAMISDPELDLYNRLAIYRLFRSCIGYLDGEPEQKAKARLAEAVRTFPKEIYSRIRQEEW